MNYINKFSLCTISAIIFLFCCTSCQQKPEPAIIEQVRTIAPSDIQTTSNDSKLLSLKRELKSKRAHINNIQSQEYNDIDKRIMPGIIKEAYSLGGLEQVKQEAFALLDMLKSETTFMVQGIKHQVNLLQFSKGSSLSEIELLEEKIYAHAVNNRKMKRLEGILSDLYIDHEKYNKALVYAKNDARKKHPTLGYSPQSFTKVSEIYRHLNDIVGGENYYTKLPDDIKYSKAALSGHMLLYANWSMRDGKKHLGEFGSGILPGYENKYHQVLDEYKRRY